MSEIWKGNCDWAWEECTGWVFVCDTQIPDEIVQAGDTVQLKEHLPSKHKPSGSVLRMPKAGVVVHICNPNPRGAKARTSEVQGHPWPGLCRKKILAFKTIILGNGIMKKWSQLVSVCLRACLGRLFLPQGTRVTGCDLQRPKPDHLFRLSQASVAEPGEWHFAGDKLPSF